MNPQFVLSEGGAGTGYLRIQIIIDHHISNPTSIPNLGWFACASDRPLYSVRM